MDVGLRRWIVLVVALGALAIAGAVAGQERTKPYLRVVEEDGGDTIALEVAVREFRHADESKPLVYLTGAVHIGDRAFYDSLQAFLDGQDVVLFEGVKPAGSGAEHHDGELDDPAKAAKTERRLRFLAIAAERYKAERGEQPASLEELADGSDARIGSLVRRSMVDAWGNAIVYVPPAAPAEEPADAGAGQARKRRARADFVSRGADGTEGGDGIDADLRFSDQKALTREERGGGDGIQAQLADAMNLVFQLDAMDESKPNWRNSDLSIDQVQERLDESGADGGSLFGMLDGSSFMGRLAGILIRAMGATAQGRVMFKIMLAELLSRADEMFAHLPDEMGSLMDVLIKDRNAIVMEDLGRVLEDEPGVRTIGVIYGAGHLPDLEARLREMGYTPRGDTWRPAITVSSAGEGLPKGSVRETRPMIKSMIEMQLRQLRAMQKKQTQKKP